MYFNVKIMSKSRVKFAAKELHPCEISDLDFVYESYQSLDFVDDFNLVSSEIHSK